MTQQPKQIPISAIILDEKIYPRKGIDHRRVGIFAENIRDGFAFDPIEVAPCPLTSPIFTVCWMGHTDGAPINQWG